MSRPIYTGATFETMLDVPKSIPEVALYRAIVGQAVHDLMRLKCIHDVPNAYRLEAGRYGWQAYGWFLGEVDALVPFEYCCDALDFDADTLIEKLGAAGLFPKVV